MLGIQQGRLNGGTATPQSVYQTHLLALAVLLRTTEECIVLALQLPMLTAPTAILIYPSVSPRHHSQVEDLGYAIGKEGIECREREFTATANRQEEEE